MTDVIQHVRPSGARRAAASALAAAAVALAAAPAFAQYTGGGVTYDPGTLANNFLTWFQPVATVVAGAVTIGGCMGAAGNGRQVAGIAGTGAAVVGLIWGIPYLPTAMGVAGALISRT